MHLFIYLFFFFSSGENVKHSILKKGAVPSIFPWNIAKYIKKQKKRKEFWRSWFKKIAFEMLDDMIAEKALRCRISNTLNSLQKEGVLYLSPQEEEFINNDAECEESSSASNVFKINDSFVNEVIISDDKSEEEVDCSQDLEFNVNFYEPKRKEKFSFYLTIEKIKWDNDAVHFFTGLESFDRFLFAYRTLGPAVNELLYVYGGKPSTYISPLNQFFLTLVILRQHKTYYEVSMLFNIPEKQVGNIFITWLRFMHLQWSEIPQWPSKDLVNFYLPSDFRCKFPDTRGVVDATEVPILKPGNPLAQQCTFSTYKHKNTVKSVVTMTPGGLISNVTSTYGGSTSDRQVIERSNFFKMCDPGDSIMVDKGFDIQDLLAPYKVKLNIPSFFKKKNQLSISNKGTNKTISSKRVHIERIIGLEKTYKILQGTLTASQTLLSEEIFFVCSVLCNFRHNIMNSDS